MRVDTFLTEEFDLTEGQSEFLNKDTATASTANINQTRNMSEMFLSLTIKKVAKELIESSKEISASANKATRRLGFYTLALVFVGIVQILTMLFVNFSR